MSDDTGLDVLGTTVNQQNGAISAQLGDSATSEATRDGAEWWQHVGFASRPSRATQNGASCQVLSTEGIDRDVCYASRDLRSQAAAKALGDGETMIFAPGPDTTGTGRLELLDDDASATIKLSVRAGNDPAQPRIGIEVSSGGSVTISAGSTTITIDQAGTVTVQATTIALGGAGGLPVVTNTPALVAFFAGVAAALTGLGVPTVPPSVYTATTTTAA